MQRFFRTLGIDPRFSDPSAPATNGDSNALDVWTGTMIVWPSMTTAL